MQSRPFVAVAKISTCLGQGRTRDPTVGQAQSLCFLQRRRGWDSNPRWVSPHTISSRADSAALAPLLEDLHASASRSVTGLAHRRTSAIRYASLVMLR